jgi:archaellum biogenesis ATPase FlaH
VSEKKTLAAIISSREAHERVADYLDESDFTAQGKLILRAVEAYYKRDKDASRVDTGLLLEQIDKGLGNAKKLGTFKEVLAGLPYDIGAENVADSLLEQKRDAAADRLANALAERSGKEHGEITQLLEEYTAVHEATDLAGVAPITAYEVGVEELFTDVLADQRRIKILPKALNEMVGGGAYPGHCIILFGRTEMGKSMFAINAAVGFVAQDLDVLYIENEDSLQDTQRRFIQRLIRRPREWCSANAQQASEMAARKGAHRFTLTEDPETLKDVESAILRYDPDVVVINQMRNMVSGEGQVEKLGSLAHGLRRLGKRHRKLMLLITAAREGEPDRNGNVRDKIMLERADVYSSRTGIPAAADLLLGWGGSKTLMANCQAGLSVVKNKLVDVGGHGAMYCTVDPATGRIEGEGY